MCPWGVRPPPALALPLAPWVSYSLSIAQHRDLQSYRLPALAPGALASPPPHDLAEGYLEVPVKNLYKDTLGGRGPVVIL